MHIFFTNIQFCFPIKVGFNNCNEHTSFIKIKLEAISEGKGRITFHVDTLPKEEGEFYQFVYVSQGKQIRGASVPFQFKFGDVNELIEDEEQDAIVIKLITFQITTKKT